MFKHLKPLTLAATLLLAAGLSHAAPPAIANGVMAAPNGMTLYTFDKDAANSGKSVCNGPCATLWPPALAMSGDQPTGAYTIITRDDGAKQWAYRGKPLYFYQADQKAGERNGDNFKDVWHVVKD